MKFGEFIKNKRLKANLSLRKFCELAEIDPSNWSKIERGRLPLSYGRPKLEKIAKVLKLKKGSEEWSEFFDLVFIAQRKIPDDLYKDEEVVSALPVFFRTLKGDKPSEEEWDKIIKLLRRRQGRYSITYSFRSNPYF